MTIKLVGMGLGLLTICSCAGQATSTTSIKPESAEKTNREEAVSLLGNAYKSIRDTERGTYDLLYELRDGMDGIIYDAQKNYYGDYQK